MVEQFPSLYPEAKKERHRQEVVSRRRGHAQQAENLQREQEAKEKSTQPCGIQVVEERNVFLEQLASTHNVSSPSGQRGSKLQDEVSQQLAGLLRGH